MMLARKWLMGVFVSLSFCHSVLWSLAEQEHPWLERRQGMEILDYDFIPPLIRQPIYNSLGLTQKVAGLKDILEKHVFAEVVKLETTDLFELGSGSGHSIKILAKKSTKEGFSKEQLMFHVTDKFPSFNLWQSNLKHNQNIMLHQQPLDFAEINRLDAHEGRLTFLIIAASHHMGDDILHRFFLDCAKLRANVIILEPLERKFRHAALSVMGSFVGMLTPFMKNLSLKERWQQVLIYYSGLGLFIQSYDGVMSTLRQRTRHELAHLLSDLPYEIYHFNNLGPLANYSITSFQFNDAGTIKK